MVVATAALGPVIGLVIGGLGGGGGALTVRRVADRLSGTALTRIFALLLLLVGIFVGVKSLLAG